MTTCMLMRMPKLMLNKMEMMVRIMNKLMVMNQKKLQMVKKNNKEFHKLLLKLNLLLLLKRNHPITSTRPALELTHHLPLMERNLLRKARKL